MKRFKPSITEEEVSQIIVQIDLDGSGKISLDGKAFVQNYSSNFFLNKTK